MEEVLGRKLGFAGPRPVLYLRSDNALIVADIHFGYEEALASQGVFVYGSQFGKVMSAAKEAIASTGAKRLIINGDIKHVFERLTRQERREVKEFLLQLGEAGVKEIILVRGNHDNYVSPLLKDHGVSIVEDVLDIGEFSITHGHLEVELKGDYVIMGHEHPAVQISVGAYREKFKALLIMPTEKGKTLFVLPALGEYQFGNAAGLERESYLSPIIRSSGIPRRALPVLVDPRLGVYSLVELEELYA
ncbi:MAG: metallophosphoesterase [Acidilobaceae archaeon]|nr:metallophosphoesterase [Acidilobaceae archaeon]MCX8165474.1 metallophosphoesterase [Acidilobaceae archaeon]MDW7973901.1 metallophosphoesterase [Sulfolobales archaeon]